MAGKQESKCSPDKQELSGEDEEEISRLQQYHPLLQKNMVKEVMSEFARQPGSYLIRKSQSQKGAYTVSVMHTDLHLYHFKILQRGRTYGVVPDQFFPSVAAMLDYYSSHDIPGSNVKHIRLRNPISRFKGFRQERKSDSSAEENPSQRYVSIPFAGSADGREHVKGSPLQLQQGLPSPPQNPPTDDMLAGHYDIPRSQVSTLMSQVEEIEGTCSCGIPHQMAHLAHGWEVHRVHRKEDTRHFGKLFFYNRRTEETLWTLPPSISGQLTEESRRNMDHLECKSREFLQDKK